jgi:ferredoxin-NADP reductase/DMSO/TMAO reductase YedYZ heme-binding membrane subunit
MAWAVAVGESLVRPAGASRIWAGGLSTTAMLVVAGQMARGNGPAVRARIDPAVWWYVARASGLIAWTLLGASAVGGLLLATRLARGLRRTWTQGLHEFVGALAVVFTAVHLASVLAADQLGIGLRELLVPFARPNNPVAQGCGAVAFYLLTAVALTSWARALLPWRWWRRLHLLAFPVFGLASAHTVLAGTDTAHPVLQWAFLLVGAVILFLVTLRLLTARTAGAAAVLLADPPDAPLPAPLAPQPQSAIPSSASNTAATEMRLLISQTTWEAGNVLSLRLRSPDGEPLPSWEPGAHIELALPSGRRRQYSLCGDTADTHSYRIAVLQVPEGRGGSIEVHASARAGQLITVQGPRNHFPLVPSPAYLFIAGGIGITAMLAMAARVASAGGEWKLVYTGRRRVSMAFIDEVQALGSDRVDVVPGDERGRPDLNAIIKVASPDTTVYCCGPDRLLHAVRERVTARPDLSLHSERFTGAASSGGDAFHVELRRTGRIIAVPADRTVLQTIRDVLPTVPSGCEQGICGACRTMVLAGEPDHRDELLSSAERAAGAMLICVSRARSERLILDL